MRSRRLPGSREPGQPAPGARPPVNPATRSLPSLFDGDTTAHVEAPVRKRRTAPAAPPMSFGTRSLLATALLVQAGVAALLLPRMVLVLDAISTRPSLLVPLAALGALSVGLFGWAWLLRPWGVGIAYCIVAAAWWSYFFAQSF